MHANLLTRIRTSLRARAARTPGASSFTARRLWLMAPTGLFLLLLPIMPLQGQDRTATTQPGHNAAAQRAAPTNANGDPFRLQGTRLGMLDSPDGTLGATPRPTDETARRFGRFVDRFVDADNTLDVVTGRPRILVFKRPPLRIQIPDENVARYDILTDRELSITGLNVGQTLLNIWFADPDHPSGQEILSYLVRVVPDPEARERLERVYSALEDEINNAFPTSLVNLSLVGDTLMVEGQARDIAEADRIMRVIEANAPRIEARIPVDAWDDSPDFGAMTTDAGLSSTSGMLTPGLSRFSSTPLESDGYRAAMGRSDARMGARGRTAARASSLNIVNLLKIPGEPQVSLKVTVAEVNRAGARSIGLNFSYTNNSGITVIESLTGGIATGGLANLPALLDGGQLSLAINALRGMSLAKSLAEPNLVALNGHTASFLAGGQFPVPVVTGATATGLQGVEYVPFGVELRFTPYILDRDRIRLVVTAEVSTRSVPNSTIINGQSVPGRDTRTFHTVVELRSGQTLAVAGLIQSSMGSDADRIPGAGDLPLIGWLFGFNRTTASEQELVVLITPELVHPLDKNEVPHFLPGDDIFEPDDLEFYLLGRLESRHSEDSRNVVLTDYERQGRARAFERKFILGPSGHSDQR